MMRQICCPFASFYCKSTIMYRYRHIDSVFCVYFISFRKRNWENRWKTKFYSTFGIFIATLSACHRSFSGFTVAVCLLFSPIGESIEDSLSSSSSSNVSSSIHSCGDKLSAMIMNFMINDSISYSANMKMNRQPDSLCDLHHRRIPQYLISSVDSFAHWMELAGNDWKRVTGAYIIHA